MSLRVTEAIHFISFCSCSSTAGISQYNPIQSAKYCNLIGQSRVTELDYIVKCPQCLHGAEVTLLKGFTAIVLCKDGNSKAHQTTVSNANHQPAQCLCRRLVEGEEYLDDVAETPLENRCPVIMPKLRARFDSFVLQHRDIPVEEGMDEKYLHSLF
ncbi:hypothetical protein BJV74DRAFT_465677 [Russula compacta]|nr:hypothetical protein BJV74DRAFT_465677 [Russula compacta]